MSCGVFIGRDNLKQGLMIYIEFILQPVYLYRITPRNIKYLFVWFGQVALEIGLPSTPSNYYL